MRIAPARRHAKAFGRQDRRPEHAPNRAPTTSNSGPRPSAVAPPLRAVFDAVAGSIRFAAPNAGEANRNLLTFSGNAAFRHNFPQASVDVHLGNFSQQVVSKETRWPDNLDVTILLRAATSPRAAQALASVLCWVRLWQQSQKEITSCSNNSSPPVHQRRPENR